MNLITFLLGLLGIIVAIFLYNVFQKEHSILRTFPVIGNFRYLAEWLGVYLRDYFYASDREELPFNRAQRSWVYQTAKNVDSTAAFGSTRDLHALGTMYFVAAPFPLLEKDAAETRPITFGPYCKEPYIARSLVNISGMSYGSISKNATLALAEGAKRAGCWLNTGEGGLTEYHLKSGCDLIAQIGTAKYGFRNENGELSDERLKEAAAHSQVRMFEIKLSQGAKPGKGGILPAVKVTPEIAKIRGIAVYEDSISPNRFPEISNSKELLDFIHHVRAVTGKPTGFKTVLGNYDWLDSLCQEIIERGIECAPDFITLDGKEGGTGASPLSLLDYVGLPLKESLPVLVDTLVQYGLKDRIKIIASGKLITPDEIVWALAVGADFINSARGFLLALGCIQAMRCNKNTCPTGITTHKPWLMRGLDPSNKAVRVYYYVKNLEHEVGVVCHSCGVQEPRDLRRKHVRIVTIHGTSVSLEEIYPEKEPGSKLRKLESELPK